MENSAFLSRILEWVLYQLLANSCYKAARKLRNLAIHFFKSSQPPHNKPSSSSQNAPPPFSYLPRCHHLDNLRSKTLVCDINGTIIIPSHDHSHYWHSFFPYFMLVAFEAGSIVRAFMLLISYPLLLTLQSFHQDEMIIKAMVFITFCGLKVSEVETVQRTVLPKFYMENMSKEVYELMESVGGKMVITSVPRVMVEGFLREYLGAGLVVGTEIRVLGPWFTGLVGPGGVVVKHVAVKEVLDAGGGDYGEMGANVIGVGSLGFHDTLLLSLCKEAYLVPKPRASSRLPRDRYPKPLVFHDGRLAFLPTPSATLAMFIWLPLGILLAMIRLAAGVLLPYKFARPISVFSGIRIVFNNPKNTPMPTHVAQDNTSLVGRAKGVLYVCSHRTLLDPVMLSVSLSKPLTAVTYSLSKMSEIIAPLRTVRLTRDRRQDAETMERMLKEGDLVVCPEGTTCREPYLLRFSSLFAELADEIVPVAVNTHVTMFYGTTAGGLKCLDPIFFLMNPRPCYYIHVLGKLPRDQTCAGGRSSFEVANLIQRKLADALGFECTGYTRKDKYMMLAGNEGLVDAGRTRNGSNARGSKC
ncbi:Glycerol-3-phosphate acyltransferase 1-like protein [Drosera capensis]